jgi:hypothetical protein
LHPIIQPREQASTSGARQHERKQRIANLCGVWPDWQQKYKEAGFCVLKRKKPEKVTDHQRDRAPRRSDAPLG